MKRKRTAMAMDNPNPDHLSGIDDLDEHDEHDEHEPIEAYCVRCRHMVEIQNPEPVWTSRGTAGTRGTCPDCDTVVFRMGRTPAHEKLVRPVAVRVEGGTKIATTGGRKRAQPATYINFAAADSDFARKLATDLENAGVHTWIEGDATIGQDVKWAGGIHPALKDSARMVVVMSTIAKESESVNKAWSFFKTEKKPIILAVFGTVEVPDALRRSPRFDFSSDYKTAFRQLLAALSD